MPVSVSMVCCQVEVSESGRSLVQRSPTKRSVFECDRETSTTRMQPSHEINYIDTGSQNSLLQVMQKWHHFS